MSKKINETSRIKLYRGISSYTPSAINFSELEEMATNDYGFSAEEGMSDNGELANQIVVDLEYEEMIADLIANMDEKERVIFMYQLLRDGGYKLDHGVCAKSIGINRQWYMTILKGVRNKTTLYLIGRRMREEG